LKILDASLPTGAVNDRVAQIWQRLPSIPDQTQTTTPPASSDRPIADGEVLNRLKDMLGKKAIRHGQEAYCLSLASAFARKAEQTQMVLAEAGTGTGKTLGYLAPATVWAETNEASVWISTYTRNLQHQIEDETKFRYADEEARKTQVVTRKGRENYLCLRNLEEKLNQAIKRNPDHLIALGLMARWAMASGDGDLTGNNYLSWLTDLFGWGLTRGLSVKSEECTHTACPHYTKCFIEHNHARARQSNIVIANHAVVMIMALINSIIPRPDRPMPARYVFDEGHHLFDAADSAFAIEFTAEKVADLRRWLRGDEKNRHGINQRLRYALEKRDDGLEALKQVEKAATLLPGGDWKKLLVIKSEASAMEGLFSLLREIVLEESKNKNGDYSLEVRIQKKHEEAMTAKITEAYEDIKTLMAAVRYLNRILENLLKAEGDVLEKQNRQIIEGINRGLQWRVLHPLDAWRGLIASILDKETDKRYVDWLELTKSDGKESDIGIHRHWLDPTRPFYDLVLKRADGVVVTSASLTDHRPKTSHVYNNGNGNGNSAEWEFAEKLVGARYLKHPASHVNVSSPFDYAQQARIFVVNDVPALDYGKGYGKTFSGQAEAQAEAIAKLMIAAGGGGLALFTAISRLKMVHPCLASLLAKAGLPLYAQHIGRTSRNTLVQVFRAEPDSCLMGTDALRDGVDVPGESLRLIVFDRVPWPRNDVLFTARAAAFGREDWRNRLVRMRLRQAFGRLIRHEDDRGIFVMLNPQMAKFRDAFPPEIKIVTASIDAVEGKVKNFFADR
ncbi:MAG: ATP-dependent DNA helicase, partial [Proteobacteria bacterium]|nr:ATP-dependent DNA helicase [Pseudomonadota bacterium]